MTDGSIWAAAQAATATRKAIATASGSSRASVSGRRLFASGMRFGIRCADGRIWVGGDTLFEDVCPFATEPVDLSGAISWIAFGFNCHMVIDAAGLLVVRGRPHCPVQKTSFQGLSWPAVQMAVPGRYRRCAVGNDHFMAIDDQHRLWAWGTNLFGQLGCAEAAKLQHVSLDERLEPRMPSPKLAWELLDARRCVMTDVADVVCEQDRSFCVTRSGDMFGWGLASQGELGQPGDFVTFKQPTLLLTKVASVSAGTTHTLALTRSGDLWGWGNNELGQVHPHTCRNSAPLEITNGVVACAAGGQHSAAVMRDGSLWTWGGNEHGQLGTGNTNARRVRRPIGHGYLDVAAGQSFTLAQRADGGVDALGWLGLMDPDYPDDPALALRPLRVA